MIDTIELYILIQVLLTLTLIQGQRSARIKNFCGNYFTKFPSDLKGVGILLRLVCVMNLILIYVVRSMLKGEKPVYVLSFKNMLVFRHLHAVFFQTWRYDRDH